VPILTGLSGLGYKKWFERKSVSSRSVLPLKKTDSGQESPSGLLKAPLPPVNDSEGQYVPASLPFIVDAHVHFFPDHFFSAVWQWFEQFGWPIRYRLTSPEIPDTALEKILGKNALEFYSIT
jgi:hypothetical protein